MSPAAPAEPHRRERKKRQTRDALVRAALRLFDAKGYEQTAVREITDAVDVSERTFFQYFANKEDLALSFARDTTEALLRELAARPTAEPPLTALRNAFRQSLLTLAEGDGPLADEAMYLLVIRLIDSTPALLAAHLRYAHEHDDDITSFVYRTSVALDRDKVEDFFSAMVATYGAAMLRYKGVLDLHGLEHRTVFQGVHMIFGANIDKPWGKHETRETKIVFIGKQLPADLFKSGLDNCMIGKDLRH